MELVHGYLARYPTRLAAYLALQRALMRHYVARGGTAEGFSAHLSAAYRQRFGPVFFAGERAGEGSTAIQRREGVA